MVHDVSFSLFPFFFASFNGGEIFLSVLHPNECLGFDWELIGPFLIFIAMDFFLF